MSQQFRNPLQGHPKTRQRKDRQQRPVYDVVPNVLTPRRAKVAEALRNTLWFFTVAGLGLLFLGQPHQDVAGAIVLSAVGFAVCGVEHLLVRTLFRRKTRIRLSVDEIAVKGVLFWRRYDRSLSHSFILLPHDRCYDESVDIDHAGRLAAQQGQVTKPVIWYQKSFHVVLSYGGHRNDLLEVYGPKEAFAILSRLQYIDGVLDNVLMPGRGNRRSAGGDWHAMPGGVSHG